MAEIADTAITSYCGDAKETKALEPVSTPTNPDTYTCPPQTQEDTHV